MYKNTVLFNIINKYMIDKQEYVRMRRLLRIMLILAFTAALFAAFAITASAKNWYATESTTDVERLYITAADKAPSDGKSWSETVPSKYDGNGVSAWIFLQDSYLPVEIIIDGDVVCPNGDSLDFGIKCDNNTHHSVEITGADKDSSLTINLTRRTIENYSAAIWVIGYNNLTIKNLTLSLSSADAELNSSGITVWHSDLELNNVVIESITTGDAFDYSCAIHNVNGCITIINSKIENITTGSATNVAGIRTEAAMCVVSITDSIIKINLTEPNAVGISTLYLYSLLNNLNAKYPYDIEIAAAGRAYNNIYATVSSNNLRYRAGDVAPGEELSGGDFIIKIVGFRTEPAKYARIYIQRVVTPVITESTVNQQGQKRITITCSTPDARIYYRLDGGEIASPEDGTLYTGPFEVGENVTVTARGFADGYAKSELATLAVESNYNFSVAVMQYMSLIANQPTYGVSVTGGVKVAVKAGLNPNALRAGELVTLTVEAGEDGEYTAPTVTTAGGGKVYLTDLGGGVYTFKMPSRSVIVKP